MKRHFWLIRREIWESRAIWVVPALIGALLVLAALFGHVDVVLSNVSPQRGALGGVLLFASGAVFLLAMTTYSAWYLLDCLHSERSDHSILFWKCLPISDTATVLSKLLMGLLVIPFIYFAIADLTTLTIAFVVSVRARSWIGASLWNPGQWLQLQVLWVYVIATLAVWFLPVAGWLLLVSAWARRALTLWSFLPPLGAIWAERVFFGTSVLAHAVTSRLFMGYPGDAFHDFQGSIFALAGFPVAGRSAAPGDVWSLIDPVGFATHRATWIGIAVGVALIFVAIRLRSRSVEL
ncbi:MAG: hypothetical protein HKM03_01840 [Steroidobacteraceae bacterium]|nr:hypothetical protein [Steroidobacteraceae bacterium]